MSVKLIRWGFSNWIGRPSERSERFLLVCNAVTGSSTVAFTIYGSSALHGSGIASIIEERAVDLTALY